MKWEREIADAYFYGEDIKKKTKPIYIQVSCYNKLMHWTCNNFKVVGFPIIFPWMLLDLEGLIIFYMYEVREKDAYFYGEDIKKRPKFNLENFLSLGIFLMASP